MYIEQILAKKVIFENLVQIGTDFVIRNWGNSYYDSEEILLLQLKAGIANLGNSYKSVEKKAFLMKIIFCSFPRKHFIKTMKVS